MSDLLKKIVELLGSGAISKEIAEQAMSLALQDKLDFDKLGSMVLSHMLNKTSTIKQAIGTKPKVDVKAKSSDKSLDKSPDKSSDKLQNKLQAKPTDKPKQQTVGNTKPIIKRKELVLVTSNTPVQVSNNEASSSMENSKEQVTSVSWADVPIESSECVSKEYPTPQEAAKAEATKAEAAKAARVHCPDDDWDNGLASLPGSPRSGKAESPRSGKAESPSLKPGWKETNKLVSSLKTTQNEEWTPVVTKRKNSTEYVVPSYKEIKFHNHDELNDWLDEKLQEDETYYDVREMDGTTSLFAIFEGKYPFPSFRDFFNVHKFHSIKINGKLIKIPVVAYYDDDGNFHPGWIYDSGYYKFKRDSAFLHRVNFKTLNWEHFIEDPNNSSKLKSITKEQMFKTLYPSPY